MDIYKVVNEFKSVFGGLMERGELFHVEQYNGPAGEYEISDTTGLWKTTITRQDFYANCVLTSSHLTAGTSTISNRPFDYAILGKSPGNDVPPPPPELKECQCGSHSVGSDKHSTWCQLWSK